MSQKQNNKFVLDRLYPQYFKPQKKPENTQQSKITNNPKTKQQRKIQNKLKNIIYNLQRQLQQQQMLRRSRNSNQTSHHKAPSRSFSQKSLGSVAKRAHTQIQYNQESQNTDRTGITGNYKKNLPNNIRQTQALILPKLKLNNKITQLPYKKQLLAKKKLHKLYNLDEQQQQLGKIVLQKVQKHFQMDRKGKQLYYERVKSEEGIDQSFINYLRNKVKKANIVLQA